MHAARLAALTPTTGGNRLQPAALGATTSTRVTPTKTFASFWLLACRSNRLQHLIPAAPAVEQAEVDEGHHQTHDGAAGAHIITSSELESRVYQAVDSPAIDSKPQQLEDVQQHVEDSNQILRAPQQMVSEPQQLCSWPTFTSSGDWTSSQDDDIQSAIATLPRDAFPGDGTFVGGRFTFRDSNSIGKATYAATELQEHTAANRHLTTEADASGWATQALRETEPQLQQGVSYNPAVPDSNSTTSSISSDSTNASKDLQDSSVLPEGVHDSSHLTEGLLNNSHHQQNLKDSSTVDHMIATAAGSAAAHETSAAAAALLEESTVSYYSSRNTMLRQLHHQQLQVQRDHLLNKQRKKLYNYTMSDSGRIIKRSKPGPKSPLAQTTFALAKKQPVQSGTATAAGDDDVDATVASRRTIEEVDSSSESKARSVQQQSLQQRRHRMQQMLPLDEAQAELLPGLDRSGRRSTTQINSGSRTKGSSRGSQSPTASVTNPTTAAAGDLSRGLCLSVFLYCCSQSKLLDLTWQLGLPPNAVSFVSRVADADVVLHVKPKAGEKHFHYDEVRVACDDRFYRATRCF